MKILGQVKVANVFIRGTERKQGVNKAGTAYDFTVVRFDDETGEGFDLRLESDVSVDRFPRRTEGDLIANVYHGTFKGASTTYLKVVDFEPYKD